MLRLAPSIAALALPPIPAVQGWGRAWDGRLGPVIDLSQAVPGYPPHPDLLATLGRVAADPRSAGYGPIEGEAALRGAYARHQSDLYGAELRAEHIHVTAGCNQAFVCATVALAEAGSRVLLTNPNYFNHRTSLEMFGIGVDLLDCPAATGFLPDPAAFEAAITPEIRALAIVSPNNPTGAVYPPDLVEALFEVAKRNGIALILDETYRDFLAPEAGRPHRLFERADWEGTLVSLYSFSKSFCIPGHRLGAITAAPSFVAAVAKIMDNLQICAPRVGQIAVAETIDALAPWRAANRAEIARRAKTLVEVLGGLAGWEIGAIGAYFAFVRHPFAGATSWAVAEKLAKEAGIVTIPGACFGPGQDDFLRFAFANAGVEVLSRLADRLPAGD